MMVSHSMTDVARLADRILVMQDGKVAMDGVPSEIFAHADQLKEMGLDIPDITRVFLKLKELGLPVSPVYTLQQAVAALQEIKGGSGHA